MKIIIVDNGTKHLSELESLFIAHSVVVIQYSDIGVFDFVSVDAIILSGSHTFQVSGNENLLKEEIDLVTNLKKPIFGICFGFELIARAFGAKLSELKEKEKGIINIQIDKLDKIFTGISNYQVYEGHRWVVKNLPDDLIALARSKDGIEVFKHINRPIYAVQFHPEVLVDKTCGSKLIANFLDMISSKN